MRFPTTIMDTHTCANTKKLAALLFIAMLASVAAMPLVQPVEAAPTQMAKLHVSGSALYDETGQRFYSLGCNVRGEQYNPARDGRYDDWYTYRNSDAARIASWGFNTVRLWVYWENLETSQSPSQFTYNEQYIRQLAETVKAYNDRGIYVIIDIHEHPSVNTLGRFVPTAGNDFAFADSFYSSTSATSAREHLKRLWLRLSEEFRDTPGVIYEILNEPHHSGSLSAQQVMAYWVSICDYVTSALRAAGDDHVVMVGMAPWARSAVPMTTTCRDGNTVYTVHFYAGHSSEGQTLQSGADTMSWMTSEYSSTVSNHLSKEFKVPYILGEQGWGTQSVSEGTAQGRWLTNLLTVSSQDPYCVGFSYFLYATSGGSPMGSGWQSILNKYLDATPTAYVSGGAPTTPTDATTPTTPTNTTVPNTPTTPTNTTVPTTPTNTTTPTAPANTTTPTTPADTTNDTNTGDPVTPPTNTTVPSEPNGPILIRLTIYIVDANGNEYQHTVTGSGSTLTLNIYIQNA